MTTTIGEIIIIVENGAAFISSLEMITITRSQWNDIQRSKRIRQQLSGDEIQLCDEIKRPHDSLSFTVTFVPRLDSNERQLMYAYKRSWNKRFISVVNIFFSVKYTIPLSITDRTRYCYNARAKNIVFNNSKMIEIPNDYRKLMVAENTEIGVCYVGLILVFLPHMGHTNSPSYLERRSRHITIHNDNVELPIVD